MARAAPERGYENTPEMAEKVRNSRNPLAELREAQAFLLQDVKRADQIITRGIRDQCRPEIDDYVDCTTGRTLSVIVCRDLAMKMRRCLIKYKTAINIEEKRNEIVDELVKKGETLDRDMLSRRNNMFKPTSNDNRESSST